jgi:hypothetical protein
MNRLAAAAAAALCVALAAGSAGASPTERSAFDPFRPQASSGAAGVPAARVRLDPFRVADAQPAPAQAAPAPAATPAPPVCRRDEDCPAENICENSRCELIQHRTNVLYLYYREGSFTELFGLYWSKRGSSGYRIVAPIYWHYWSPESQSRVVAPFYWRFENYAEQSTTTVIVPGLPISWSRRPDARSLGVWPIFYASTKFGWAAPLLGTFKVGDPDHGRAFGAWLYLYWWKRAPEASFDLLFPLFVSSRSKDHTFTYALPLNFYWRDKDDENLLVLPLFYSNVHKNGGSTYALTGYRTHEGDSMTGSLFWLYWYGRDAKDKSAYDVFFPLVWSFRSPASATTVAGPFVHLRRDNWSFSTVFPLWYSGGDRDKGYEFATLPPLFYWQRTEHGKKAMWLTPLGGYSRDDTEGSRTMALFPLVFMRRDRETDFQIVTPFYVRFRDRAAGSSTSLISLLLYLRDDPEGSTSVFFPLFWHFRDAPSGATATAFLPFYAHRSGPQDESTIAGIGIWGYRREYRDGGWGAGVFPLLFLGRRGDASHAVFFPLYWHFRSAQQRTTIFAPFYFTHSDREGTDSGILPLLAFFGDHGGERYVVQFPLYWRFSSEREGWTTTATPAGYFQERRDGWSMGVGPIVPLFFAGRSPGRSYVGLVPLFWHERNDAEKRSTTQVLLYMHRTVGNETTDALFPFIYLRRGARAGGGDETSFTFFPIIHYRRDATTRLFITPIGGAKRTPDKDAGFAALYFWWHDAAFDARGLVPLYLDVTNRATQERTRQLGIWFAIDAPGRRSRLLFPFYGRYDDAHEHDTYVFPTYFRQRTDDGYAVDTFFPLYWRSRFKDRTSTFVGLWYKITAPGTHDTGLVPIYFYAKNDQRSVTVVPPALLYRRADFREHTTSLFAALIFYRSTAPNADSTVVFPLWWSGHEGEKSRRIFFPVYWHFADTSKKSEVNVLGPVFWTRSGTGHTRGLAPLAWVSDDPATGRGSSAFLPIFFERHGPNRSTFLTLLGGYDRGETSHTWYVLPVLFNDGITSRFRTVFPLWFSYTNKVTESHTRVIPPLLNVTRTTPDSKFSTYLLLYWRFRDIASVTTLVVPVYWDFHDINQSRTTIVFPLLFRHHNDTEQTTYWLAPLFYRHSTPTDSTTVGFPLVWDFKRGPDHRTTLVLPFYAHWRRASYASTYIFPTYYYTEGRGPSGPDGTYRRLIAPFFESAVKRPGDYMWEVLGGLFGTERIGRNHYLKLFFMTFETQAPAHVQTSWYTAARPASRKAPPRGLDTRVW